MPSEVNNKLNVTIDSSIIVSYLLKFESHSSIAERIWNKVLLDQYECFEPITCLVEISSAVYRRTKNRKLAFDVKTEIELLPNFNLVEITKQRTQASINLALKYGLRSMDSFFVQVSEEFDTKLLTFDKELIDKLKLENILNEN